MSRPPSSLYAGQTVFGWLVVHSDGKRALCLCQCGVARELGVAALLSGEAPRGCGCARTPGPRFKADSPAPSSFASSITSAENFSATHRHKLRGQL